MVGSRVVTAVNPHREAYGGCRGTRRDGAVHDESIDAGPMGRRPIAGALLERRSSPAPVDRGHDPITGTRVSRRP